MKKTPQKAWSVRGIPETMVRRRLDFLKLYEECVSGNVAVRLSEHSPLEISDAFRLLASFLERQLDVRHVLLDLLFLLAQSLERLDRFVVLALKKEPGRGLGHKRPHEQSDACNAVLGDER
jgi:hypothetical protein